MAETERFQRGIWATFTAAPHRVMMFGGSLQLVLTLVYWLLELLARQRGTSLSLASDAPPLWLHGYLMLFGLFPYFIFGFLMTTYPRWMNGPLVRRSRYVTAFLCMATGNLTFYIGLVTSHSVLGIAVLLHAIGWFIGYLELIRVFKAASNPDKTYESYLNLYLGLGTLAMLTFGMGLMLDKADWLQIALQLGLWGFLLPIVITVAHRMLPFFSGVVLTPYREVRPAWMLPLLPLLLASHLAFDYLGTPQWRFVVDLPLAVGGLYLSYVWGLRRSFEVRLLAILHLAFVWFGIGMAMYALDSLLLWSQLAVDLGRAPLHALAIGLIAGLTLAMASRVSLGHSGRPLIAGQLIWLCCWGLQLSVALRIAGDISLNQQLLFPHANLWASYVWLSCALAWTAHFAPIYWRPRADGRSG